MAPRKSTAASAPSVPGMDRVADGVREVIRAVAPELRLERKWGQPWYVGTDLVCAVVTYAHHVGVEFWRGTSLKDPHHLLEGTGKNLRHVKVRTPVATTAPGLIALLREAVRLDAAEPPGRR